MRHIYILILGVLLCGAGLTSALAGKASHQHGPVMPLEVVPETKRYMNQMEAAYLRLQMLSHKDMADFKSIAAELKNMDQAARKVVKINKNIKLNELIKGLRKQIEDVMEANEKKHQEGVVMHLDVLHVTCFACHTTHAKPID